MEVSVATVEVWAKAARHWNPVVRWATRRIAFQSAIALRRRAEPRDSAVLAALLSFPDSDVVAQSARALAKIGGDEAIHSLAERLSQPDALNPEILAWALARLRASDAVPVLCQRARRGLPDAVRALGLIGDTKASIVLVALLEALLTEGQKIPQRDELLSELFRAVGRLRAEKALPFLERYWEQDTSRKLPESLVYALGELGDERTTSRIANDLRADAAFRRLRNRWNTIPYKAGMEQKSRE